MKVDDYYRTAPRHRIDQSKPFASAAAFSILSSGSTIHSAASVSKLQYDHQCLTTRQTTCNDQRGAGQPKKKTTGAISLPLSLDIYYIPLAQIS
jgi:hypothetical protein